ncbi:MAG: crossover junction endodeoxyribonuclease RuvC [Polyangiaceae bacterium]|jgi:crossover junction endodeoxyribonuclease RuvC|nr:crossover junction endodeoxyribonuclease RuvC [Polyangiaceae bacterium]
MSLTVLGVDPGTRNLGWGVVRSEGTKIVHVDHGVVHADASDSLEDRLVTIDDALLEVLTRLRPDGAAVESIFFSKDAQAAAKLGHARGVILLRLRRAGLEIGEYAPTRIKKALTGRGLAEKAQVCSFVTALLGLPRPPPLDASDALAVAIAHTRMLALPPALRRAMGQG